ncbi:aromatic acid exporter family protein [Corynebacteriaceae bacterium 6-324]
MPKNDLSLDALQIFKTVIATTGTWWICVNLLDSQMPFLAPWVAFLVLQPTVSSSITSGFQTVIASGLGVLLSSAIGTYLGVEVWSYALALLLGMLGSRIPGLRQEGATIATTAVFLLSTGFTEDGPALIDRMLEISIGVVIGVGVNLLIVPPLREKQAAQTVESLRVRMGEILVEISDDFSEEWDRDKALESSKAVQQLRNDLDQSWSTVQFAKNSRRQNPRLLIQGSSGEKYEQVLTGLDEAVAHLRNLTRTLETTGSLESPRDQHFRERWSAILKTIAMRISDPDADVEPSVDQLDRLARKMVAENQLSETSWPLYGALISSTRNISILIEQLSTATEEQRN